jgi:hypothetical protein
MHLSWLPPAYRNALLSFMAHLDRRIWAAPTQDIVALCEANGLRYGRVRELVVGFRRVVRDLDGEVGEKMEMREGEER